MGIKRIRDLREDHDITQQEISDDLLGLTDDPAPRPASRQKP